MRGLKRLLKNRISKVYVGEGWTNKPVDSGGSAKISFQPNIDDGFHNVYFDVRNIITDTSETELNNYVQRLSGNINRFTRLGDNLQITEYGGLNQANTVKLYQRGNKEYFYNVKAFRAGVDNMNANSFPFTKIDLTNFPNIEVIQLNSETFGGALTHLYLHPKASENLRRITRTASNTNLDVSFLSNLYNIETININNQGRSLPHILELPYNENLRTLIYYNSSGLNNIVGLDLLPELTTLVIFNSVNFLPNTIDLTNNKKLVTLEIANLNLTSLDLTENQLIETLYLGRTNQNNTNSFSSNIVGHDTLNLKILATVNAGVSDYLFDLDNYPNLEELYMRNTSPIKKGSPVKMNSTVPLPNLKIIQSQRQTSPVTLKMSLTPNLTSLENYGSNDYNFIIEEFQYATKLNNLHITGCFTSNPYIDLSNTSLSSISRIVDFKGMQTLKLPDRNLGLVWVASNSDLHTIQNLNLSYTRQNIRVFQNSLTELSISNITNISELSFGGGSETFTTIDGFSSKSNNLTIINIYQCPFEFNGEISGNFNNASYISIMNTNCGVAYSVPHVFPATMRAVKINPKSGFGLAIDGDQVANLIIDVSTKNWTAGQIEVAVPNSGYRVIDLRGNCATPTPSPELTTALNLLISKGVTVLTN